MSKNIKVILFSLAILLNHHASFAADEKVLQLGLSTFVGSNCPFSNDAVQNAIEGEFLRARVKPTKDREFYLYVNVNCLEIKAGDRLTGYAVFNDARFGIELKDSTSFLIENYFFGSMLTGSLDSASKQFFIQSIQGSASKALTEYLKMSID